ncbi:ribonuclease H-like domain-containing protein [Tanacetum coccineum]
MEVGLLSTTADCKIPIPQSQGNKISVLKRTVGEVEQEYEPTFVEEKQDRRNEMKARGTLLMALLNKDQLKNKEEIETISLDDLYNNLKIYEPKLTGSTNTSQNSQNVAFVSSNSTNSNNNSTNEADNTAFGISAAHTQSNPTSGDNLKQIDPDDLEEMDLQWEMAMLTIRARRFIKRTDKKLDGIRTSGLIRGKENSRRTVTVETPTKNALEVLPIQILSQVCDKFKIGLGYNAASPAVESFVNSSKMLENQEHNKSKSDKGYHAVPLPYTGNFIPFKPNLIFMDEIVKSENVDVNTVVTPSDVKKIMSNYESADIKNSDDAVEPKTVRKNSFKPPIIEDLNSDDESEVDYIHYVKNKTVRPSTEKIKFDKSARETVEKVERSVWNNSSRMNHKNFANKMTHPHPNRKFVPQAVLTRSGKINTAGASVNIVVRPVTTAGSKPTVNHTRSISNAYKKGYSQVTRPFNKYSANKNSIFNKNVNTVRVKDTTARDRAVQKEYKEKGVIDSGCSRNMTGNKCYLTEYEDYDGGLVSFGDGKGRICRKGKIKTGTLDFDNMYFCKELKYNLFSVSQICDKKNNVLFTDTAYLVLSFNFKLLDESQVLLRVPRKDSIYSVDLKSVVPTKGETLLEVCLQRFLKMTILMSLVRKESNTKPPDETSRILKTFITEIENQLDYKVKVIRSDNGTKFKNSAMNQFYEMKGIKREFSVVMTPQQNGVAERKNRTLIEAVRTMVLVIKPHTKTPYELIHGRTPLIDFMKPFGCPVTILNTRDHLCKFDGKAYEGFFVGYSVVSKAMRVFNKRTKIVKETINIRFLENAPNVIGNEPDWLFDVDSLSKSMNYIPVIVGNQTNGIAGKRDNIVADQAEKKIEPEQEYILIPFCITGPLISQGPKDTEEDVGMKTTEEKQTNSTNSFNIVGTPVSAAGPSFTNDDPSSLVNAAEP